MKRSGFKRKTSSEIKKIGFNKRSKLRVVGHSTTAEIKQEIQSILRQIVIRRDGGCILRHYQDEIRSNSLDLLSPICLLTIL